LSRQQICRGIQQEMDNAEREKGGIIPFTLGSITYLY